MDKVQRNYDGGDTKTAMMNLLQAQLDELYKHAEDLYDAARAHQELNVCYRMAKRPSDKLFKRLDKARHALEAYDAAYPKDGSRG